MGPTDQQWLFRQGDLILGPVSPQQIIDKLYSGEVSGQSEVQLMGSGSFQRISDVSEFKLHVAKAEAKRRVEDHVQARQATARKQLLTKAGLLGTALVILAVAVAAVGSYLAIHFEWSDRDETSQITIEALAISQASRRVDEELVFYRSSGKRAGAASGTGTGRAAGAAPGVKPKPGSTDPSSPDPEGLELGEVDTSAINSVVAQYKAGLKPCLVEVAKPGVVAQIPIEFSIAETGKVTKVWVDNPDFKDTNLQQCLLEELQKWPFKPGTSGASVKLSFNIGKRG